MNPHLFLLGCPRSGTTLLQRILDAHPRIAVMYEGQWISRIYHQRKGITEEGFVTGEIMESLFQHVRFPFLGISREEVLKILASRNSMTYRDLVSALCELYGEKRGKELVGDKTPGYVRSMQMLSTLFPWSKFVHLIRDGRDVCLAALNWRGAHSIRACPTWNDDRVATIALWWERYVRLGLESSVRLGPKCIYEIRYERLVSDPVEECRRLCSFLEVSYAPSMLRFYENRPVRRIPAGAETNAKWLPVMSGLRNWRFQMSNSDLELFEAVSGDLLGELGYNVVFRSISSKTREQAASVRRKFVSFFRGRESVLPKQW